VKAAIVATSGVLLLVLSSGRPVVVQSQPARLSLELQDYAALPITADNTDANTRSQLARVNYLRDEPSGRRFFVNDLNGPLYILDKAYDATCAACHGDRAQGAVKAGIVISIIEEQHGKQPPDLTDDQWDHGSSDAAVFNAIKRGCAVYDDGGLRRRAVRRRNPQRSQLPAQPARREIEVSAHEQQHHAQGRRYHWRQQRPR